MLNKILNCSSENQARKSIKYINKKKWPCYFFNSSTEGEKEYEEFYYHYETKYLNLYKDLGVVKYRNNQNYNFISDLMTVIYKKQTNKFSWTKNFEKKFFFAFYLIFYKKTTILIASKILSYINRCNFF